MKRLIVAVAVAAMVALMTTSAGGSQASPRCVTGKARGFVAIRPDPPHLVGTIPNRFTDRQKYVTRRYNCRRGGVQVRRVDLGSYEVLFPGVRPRVALATAISGEGVAASVEVFGDVVRVALRGPIIGDDVAARRDVPFSVVIF